MNNTIFSFTDVTIRDNGVAVLKNISFSIQKGQQWAITGNGSILIEAIAGKKQLLNGTTQKAENPILVTGTTQFKNRSNMGGDFYYQQRFNSADADDALTVTEHLSQQAQTDGYWTTENVLPLLNLGYLANESIIKLSNGETRRLLLAEALLKNPSLLLLDNPLAGLDVQSREAYNTLLEKITASGIQVVLAINATEIPKCITNVAVVEGENITGTFTPDEFSATAKENAISNSNCEKLGHLLQPIPEFEHLIKMRGVNISYGEKQILHNIDWTVKPGERWALLGHNGAGKSTLLSLINADNPQAYANDIELFDRKKGSGESIWDIKKKIGFVSGDLAKFFPTDQTCLQIIESGFHDTMGLFRKPLPNNMLTINLWMEYLGIEAHTGKIFSRADANVKQLCLLARALVKNPPLLILDEPCFGMDAIQKLFFKGIIDHICTHSPLAFIYVSHYTEELPGCINHTLMLEKGRVVQDI
ncbi:hypothetical protein AM493_12960 [Flavobacterium akiainvivens]|uniref:ABC transporter domain-containing protein n=1 Tax=Flavobacterium akiainvivens TaxID=1202724 RepID=A0A0M8MDX3_9FLAO|nr:ATP-binding cassette domain-containing protein [Flavobacterium akiainvivens]KOS06834.1 hypothetical protein AM493_12960 [Flavobacterium akiainvivens]SFQ75078.1 molybdate transport system ATP-binding protein [Flavobacterium akiainvivens]